jgi:tRNA dimethylallyltransferase
MSQYPLLIILGPTASGKTELAVNLAKSFDTEIISADSRQVFKNMDIGTGKDLSIYQDIPHHLIDIKLAGETYNVNEFKNDFYPAYHQILAKQKLPILCGGTGMYIHSLLQNQIYTAVPVNDNLRNHLQQFDKEELQNKLNQYPLVSRQFVDYHSSKRLIRAIEIADYLKYNQLPVSNQIQLNVLVIGLQSDIETRRKRILNRLEDRLENGLITEVEKLLDNGIPSAMLTFYGLEYKFITAYLSGEFNYNTLKERLGIAICQFAKRQMTFFRKMEKDGIKIKWLDTAIGANNLKEQSILMVHNKFEKNNCIFVS